MSGKAVIKSMHNGAFSGYVRSVSRAKGTFETTQDITKAKKYTNQVTLEGDIDFCTGVGFQRGYVFGYDFI